MYCGGFLACYLCYMVRYIGRISCAWMLEADYGGIYEELLCDKVLFKVYDGNYSLDYEIF